MRAPSLSSLRSVRLVLVSLAVGTAVAAGGLARAGASESTPVWPQFQGGPAHTGVGGGPAAPYRLAWLFPVAPNGQEGVSSPVVAGNVVVAVGPKAVYGVDLSSGQQVWSVPRDGPPSVPAIAETPKGLIVVYLDGRTDDVAALKAISLETQKTVWSSPPALGSVSRSGVTVDGDSAFVGDAGGDIYAVNVSTGAVRWKVTLTGEQKGPLTVADGAVFATPQSHVAADRIAATVVSLDETSGSQNWIFKPSVAGLAATLGAADDGVLAVGFQDGSLIGITTGTGVERWSARLTQPSFPFTAPAVSDGVVYLADQLGDLQAVRASTSDVDWLFAFNHAVVRGSPAIVGDDVVLGLQDGSLGVVDRETGHMVWRSRPSAGQIGALAITPSAIVTSKGGSHGGLVAFVADPDGSLVDVESPTVPHPASIAGRFAIALAIVGVILLGGLPPIGRRMGPADFSGPEPADDAIEDDGDLG